MTILFEKKFDCGSFQTLSEKPVEKIYELTQTHSNLIFNIADLSDGIIEGDGLYSLYEDLDKPMAIKTADCLPVLIMGRKGAALVHAGWRGLKNGILTKREFDIIKPMSAFIGPSISSEFYEVSESFRSEFPNSQHFNYQNGKLSFDLSAYASQQLISFYPELEVTISRECTYNNNYYSYRKNKTDKRNWNLFRKN